MERRRIGLSSLAVLLLFRFGTLYHISTADDTPKFVIVSVILNGSIVPYDNQMAGAAIHMALETVASKYNNYFQLKYVYVDGGTECVGTRIGAIASELYHTYNVSAFIGPGCSFAVEILGYMAASWNLPLICPVATKSSLANKRDYNTLTRLSHDLGKFAKFYRTIFEHFQWEHIAVIYDMNNIFPKLVGLSLHPDFQQNGLLSTEFPFSSADNPDLDDILNKASRVARVFVIATHGDIFRELMLLAKEKQMTNGKYCFIFIRLFDGDGVGDPSWRRGDSADKEARKAYESVLLVNLAKPQSPEFQNFTEEVKKRSLSEYNYDYGTAEVNNFVVEFHDAFLVYAQTLNDTLTEGGDPYDGRAITSRMWNKTFEGMSGQIAIDENGDRDTDFSLLDLDPVCGEFKVVGNYFGSSRSFSFVSEAAIHWPNGGDPPLDVPRCGFLGDAPKCNPFHLPMYAIIALAFSGVLIVVVIGGTLVYRRMKLEADLESSWWRVRWAEVHLQNKTIGCSLISTSRAEFLSSTVSPMDGVQLFSHFGTYKGNFVAIKKLQLKNISVNRGLKVELKQHPLSVLICLQLTSNQRAELPPSRAELPLYINPLEAALHAEWMLLTREQMGRMSHPGAWKVHQMRDLSHPNLVKFVGIATDAPSVSILTEYCQKGSLQDILSNPSIQLDWEFKLSLLTDICQGMMYLHQSSLGVHGHLTSSNCVIDSRFVLKLTDYGLLSLKSEEARHNKLQDQLWVAPELLRQATVGVSQKGDVYSFGIIAYEVCTRKDPYESETDTSDISEIVEKIIKGGSVPFRPSLRDADCKPEMCQLIENCWDEEPQKRTPFTVISRSLKSMSGREGSLLDSLLRRMENYANNLEQLVEERTQAFLEEKKKSEMLLYQVLPQSVADQLKNGLSVAPEAFECVTIYFSDICGFTNISAKSSPIQIIDLLNDLYTCFDSTIDHFDVYKVETIGDAYMVVSGLPLRNGNAHVREIAHMSLAILERVKHFKIRHKPDEPLRARIGVHSGPVCAGVVGLKMPRYCLFGDTVNTASRMESHGEPLKIHTSQDTKTLLDSIGGFHLEMRGEINVKGKGNMSTYWLMGRNP